MKRMTERQAGQEIGKMAREQSLSIAQATRKIKDLIREEQGLKTDEEATDYWFTLSSERKVEITRKALP